MAKQDTKNPAASRAKHASQQPAPEPVEEEEDLDEEDEEEEDEDGEEDAEDEDDAEEDDAEEDEGEDDEGVDDDEEEEEEEEPVAAAPRPMQHAAPSEPVEEGQEPGWWLPHAVLGGLILFGVLGFFGFFNDYLSAFRPKGDVKHTTHGSAEPVVTNAAPTAAPTQPTARTRPTAKPTASADAPPANPDVYGMKRVIVQFKGAQGATATRSKEEAKTRAEEALKKLKGGSKFEDIAGEYSDEPGAKATGGNSGKFKKGVFPNLEPVLDKLKIGETSEVVESPFGYEIVQRTQ